MIEDILIDIMPIIVFSFHLVDKWYLSKGRLWPVYVLAILSSLGAILFTFLLYDALGGEHKSVFLFSLNSAWTTLMSIKGIIRLIKSRKQFVQSQEPCDLLVKVASYGKK